MKYISSLLSASLLLFGACAGYDSNYNLSGDIGGVKSDTILLYISDVSSGYEYHTDTIPLIDGHFETTIADTALLELSIAAMRPYNERGPQIVADQFYFFPGDKMLLKGTLPFRLVASGTAVYDGVAKYEDYMKVTEAISAIDNELESLDENDSAKEDSLFEVSDQLKDSLNVIKLKMIKEHPNTNMAGFLSLDMSAITGVEAMKVIAQEVKDGLLSDCIRQAAEEYERDVEVIQAAEAIKPGCQAPDFELPDLKGEKITLAQFRGQYVVLDFWGSWCGWCIAGIPHMKKCYEKYHGQVEFVGICGFDTEEKWRAAVAKHKLPWVNLFDSGVTDVVKMYGVSGFPTKIIINPEGEIVAVFDGESAEFYQEMDKLLK